METKVIIESRDLDTDERERIEVAVEPAAELHQQRSTLISLVADHHPGAKLRSFADGAASFLDKQHLVVASYSPRKLARKRASVGNGAQQDELFAA